MDNKTSLRIRAKSIRKTLDIAELGRNAVEQIRELEIYKNANNVLIYYPLQYEISLLELLNDNKIFYLPKVCGNDLLVCPYSDKLEKSRFNVCEPCTNPVSAEILDLIIVPALLVDKNNYRLGYGGGFYDRFLAQYPDISTIVPVASELFVKELPRDNFDIRIDTVIKC